MCQGSTVYGEALRIAQAETPTILEYYEAVATALNELPASGSAGGPGESKAGGTALQQPYAVELDTEDEVRALRLSAAWQSKLTHCTFPKKRSLS